MRTIKLYINKINLIFKNPSAFTKNVIAVFTASVVSQFLPLITAPILTRIYSPSDYGILGILISIVSIFSVFVTLSYANVIVTAKDDDESTNVVALCIKITIWVSLIILLITIVGFKLISHWFNLTDQKKYLLIVPISVFLGGLSTIFGLVANRYQLFKILSRNRVVGVIISAIFSITIGYFTNIIVLIIGYLITQIVNSFFIMYKIYKKIILPSIPALLKYNTKDVSKKYINFPKYVLPSDFINIFSNQIPVLVISSFATNAQSSVGHYNMSNRMLGLPISLVSSSIGDVFKQRAAHDYHHYGTCRPIFMKTFKTLLITSILPFSIITIWGSVLFAFVFGEKWREAGTYTQILGIMFFFRFIVSPLTYIFFVANRQRLDFILHLLFVVIGFCSIYIGVIYFHNVKYSLAFFAGGYSLLYVLYFFLSLKFCKKNENS